MDKFPGSVDIRMAAVWKNLVGVGVEHPIENAVVDSFFTLYPPRPFSWLKC